MSVVVEESVESRRYRDTKKDGELERIFLVHGTDDPDVAVAHPDIPQHDDTFGTFDNIVCAERQVEVIICTGAESEGLCKVTAYYRKPENAAAPPPSGESEYEWSSMVQTEHITRAIAQTNYPSSADVGDLIGVDGDDVEGVDILIPKPTYKEAHYRTAFTTRYMQTLMALSGRVNNKAFKGSNAGEVLFLGAVVQRTGTDPWRFEYSFAMSAAASIAVQTLNGNQTVAKGGWDYLWFRRARTSSGDDSTIKQEIDSAHLAQVYFEADFRALGLGS